MKQIIKKVLKKILPYRIIAIKKIYFSSIHGHKKNLFQKIKGIVSILCKHKLIFPSRKLRLQVAVADQFRRLVQTQSMYRVQIIPIVY
jgi:hypothetical protein